MSYVVTIKDGVQVIVLQYVRKLVPELPDEPNAEFCSLVVTKTVIGAGDKTKSFEFTVVLDDTSISGVYGDLTFENGKAVFTLKDGESKMADGLPAGVRYEVTEVPVDGYVVTSHGEVGVIAADGLSVVEFVNDYPVEEEPDASDDSQPEKSKDELPNDSDVPKVPEKVEKPSDTKRPLVEVPDDKVPTHLELLYENGKVSGTIQTDDNGNVTMWIIVFAFVVIGMIALFRKSER